MRRFGQLIRVKPERFKEYRDIHAKVWPEVLETIRRCHIRNYSIFHWKGQLFAYFEYDGADFAADMAKMAADPKTRDWWKITMPMQEPVPGRTEGDWWATMDEVFHTD